nr:MAG TPA: hypothetical protein [Caudoviricetes sp.]
MGRLNKRKGSGSSSDMLNAISTHLNANTRLPTL